MARRVASLACVASGCVPFRGRHTQACLDDVEGKCDGCLPRLAEDGLRLCVLCGRRLAEDPIRLVLRYRDLGRVLATGEHGVGEHVSHGGRDPNVKLNGAAAAARAGIRAELVRLVRLIVLERGVHLPSVRLVVPRPPGFIGPMPLQRFVDSSLLALARMVSKHAVWLAGHRDAGAHADGLRGLMRDSYGVAFPNGMRLFPVRLPGGGGVASCPELVRARVAFAVSRRGVASEVFGKVPCVGSLWTVLRPRDDRLPAELLCNEVEAHRWPTSTWLRLGPRFAQMLAERAPVVEPPRVRGGVGPVSMRVVHDRPNILAEFEVMDAATRRVPTANGFVVVCRACKAACGFCEGRDVACVGCLGRVGEAAWGVPVEALLMGWERHVCLSMVEGGVAA